MSAQPKLRNVRDASSIDITAKLRADIMARDWTAHHIRADKAQPIELPTTRKWTWR